MSTQLTCNLCPATTVATATDPPPDWLCVGRGTNGLADYVCAECARNLPPRAADEDPVLVLDSLFQQ